MQIDVEIQGDGDWVCPNCGRTYDSQVEGSLERPQCCVHLLPVDGCECYKCTEPEYMDKPRGDIIMKNNMEYHTYGEPCEHCGRPKTEYKDLGNEGRFVCPDQPEHHRPDTADGDDLDDALNF